MALFESIFMLAKIAFYVSLILLSLYGLFLQVQPLEKNTPKTRKRIKKSPAPLATAHVVANVEQDSSTVVSEISTPEATPVESFSYSMKETVTTNSVSINNNSNNSHVQQTLQSVPSTVSNVSSSTSCEGEISDMDSPRHLDISPTTSVSSAWTARTGKLAKEASNKKISLYELNLIKKKSEERSPLPTSRSLRGRTRGESAAQENDTSVLVQSS